jgi:hypothetical protein
MNKNNINTIIATFLVLAAASARIVNAGLNLHNFVPIAAISLFSGFAFKEKRAWAILVPMLGQFLADVYFQFFTFIPGFYSVVDQLFNYTAIAGATALGFSMKQHKAINVLGFTLGSSMIFFLVSNLGFFMHGWNGYSFAGFTKTYIDAIPFYTNSFIADMVGGVVLFGGYALTINALSRKMQKAEVNA